MIKGDRALISGDEDKLGFREVAKCIAASLVDRASEDGLVIGIDGIWGSGKSSLLFLIGDELANLANDPKPTVVHFRPWLIGNRDALLTSLFSELSKQLDDVARNAGDGTRISVAKAREARDALRSFMSGLSRTASTIEFAGDASGWPLLTWLGKGIKSFSEMVSTKSAPPQLSELKDKLVKSLRELGHRFVVTIDDVDRLEPTEIIEILRLVRSVVDLPNVIYLLCYDNEILAQSIEKETGVRNGHSYLGKIVQLTVMVPKPEELQLRQWFNDELHSIASAKDGEELSRLKLVIDYEGGRQLRTPRSVKRALDSIRFFWPPLRDAKADLADLVWLQLIKDGSPLLYRWIERYCNIAAVISLGIARVEGAEKAHELAALFDSVPVGHFDELTYRHYFAEQLPGIELDESENKCRFKIFEPVRANDRDEAIRKGRLSSPDHYRLYFALTGPSHALTQDDLTSMWSAAEDGADQAGEMLLHLHEKPVAGSLTKADVLMERIRGGAYEVLTPEQCEHLLIALSQVMDECYRSQPFDLFWLNSLWDRSERSTASLLSRLQPARRASAISTIFSGGRAIGWLTSLFRHEIFAHGRCGDKPRREEMCLFTDSELDEITKSMLHRYRAMPASDVFGCPSPISLLFAWLQGGDEQGVRQFVQENIVSDGALVAMLERFLSPVDSSNRGRFNVLRKENISLFMDYKEAFARVHALKEHCDLGAQATRLAAAFDDGAEY